MATKSKRVVFKNKTLGCNSRGDLCEQVLKDLEIKLDVFQSMYTPIYIKMIHRQAYQFYAVAYMYLLKESD